MEKKEKQAKKVERILIIWAMGYALLILVNLMEGNPFWIKYDQIAAATILLILIACFFGFIRIYLKRRESKKYDTGMLARSELEA